MTQENEPQVAVPVPPDSPQVTALWQAFCRTHDYRRALQWIAQDEGPGALFVAFRSGLNAVHPAVPSLERHAAEAGSSSALLSALRGLEVLYLREGESWNDCFERVADLFHAETGFLRPGKSCLLHDDTVRSQVWDQWIAARIGNARDAIEAATGRTHEGAVPAAETTRPDGQQHGAQALGEGA